jgi:HTH-type transcriptional regulator / antitoxin HigA
MSKSLADPVDMIRRGAPRLIRSDAELAEYTRALLALTARPKPTAAEQEAINLLTFLIGHYETVRYPAPQGRGMEALRQLVKQHRLTLRSLIPELGCIANASLLLKDQRQFTRSHIARLSKRFHLSPNVFFDEASAIPLRRNMKKKSARAKSKQPAAAMKGTNQ